MWEVNEGRSVRDKVRKQDTTFGRSGYREASSALGMLNLLRCLCGALHLKISLGIAIRSSCTQVRCEISQGLDM